MSLLELFSAVFRDFSTDGLPASGDHDPVKAEVRALGANIDHALATLNGVLAFATWANLSALSTDALKTGNVARVVNDGGTHTDPLGGTVNNAGIFSFIVGTGWHRIADLSAFDTSSGNLGDGTSPETLLVSGTTANVIAQAYANDTVGARLKTRTSRGTVSSPAVITTGDSGRYEHLFWSGAAWISAGNLAFRSVAGTPSGTDMQTSFSIDTVFAGTIVRSSLLAGSDTDGLTYKGDAFISPTGGIVNPVYTAANIADITHAVNTAGKIAGKEVGDSTNHRKMVTFGSAANSPWYVVDGSASVTPS